MKAELARSLSTCCLWHFHPQAREYQGLAEAVVILLECPAQGPHKSPVLLQGQRLFP